MIIDRPDCWKVNVVVRSEYERVPQLFEPDTCDEELAAQMSMMGIHAEQALSDTRPETRLTREWLEQLPEEWKNGPMSLMVRVHWAIPGTFPSTPGAHFDVMGGNDPMDSFRPKPQEPGWEQILCVLGPDKLGTKLVSGPVPFNFRLNKKGSKNRGRTSRNKGASRLRFIRPWKKPIAKWIHSHPEQIHRMKIGEQIVMSPFTFHFAPKVHPKQEGLKPRILLRARRHVTDRDAVDRILQETRPLIAPISKNYHQPRGIGSVIKEWDFQK